MKEIIGTAIARYRKERGLTQQELAELLNISYQAVSKWETAQSDPDICLLPAIAAALGVSTDRLLGFSSGEPGSYYDSKYSGGDYYWGVKPSKMCLDVVRLMPPEKEIRVLDICCGEGKDAVFLARCGYAVSAFDISKPGVEKTKRLAEKAGVYVDVFRADICDYRLDRKYDILYSSGALHYIKPELRAEIMENYKSHTAEGGLNIFNVFVKKPFILPAPDSEGNRSWHWKSGELMTFYHDWYLEQCGEVVFDCCSSGVLHKHAMDFVAARKTKT